jgi:hypothetical protein
VFETGRDKTGEKQSHTISQRDEEKEGPCLIMPYLQISFHRGHQGRENNPRKEVDEEDPDEKEERPHIGQKGMGGISLQFFCISNSDLCHSDEFFFRSNRDVYPMVFQRIPLRAYSSISFP